ncbi:MAG TPA: hypothetical protein VGL86_05875 [Polyangia bacterium]|jgi:hypothetical protein
MSYRDDIEAAHARVAALEEELARTRAELAALKGDQKQALVLASATAIELAPRQRSAARWLGAPTVLVFTETIDGAIGDEVYSKMLEHLRREFGRAQASSFKDTVTFSTLSHRGKDVSIDVTSTGGRTTIRAEERLGPIAGGIFGGFGGAVGGGGMAGVVAATAAVAPALIPVAIVGWVGGLFVVSRFSYRAVARRRARRLQRLVAELAAIARAG